MDNVYKMKNPYFFCGEDLSDQPNAEAFVKLLCKKAGISATGVKAVAWNNSHAMYVIAQLEVRGTSKVKAIEKWFWDPKNEMLHFELQK